MSAEAATLPLGARLAGLRPLLLLVGVAAAVAIGIGVALWSQGPTYALLLTKVSNQDAAQVVQTLESAGIAYRVDTNNGSISVAADRLSDARLKLAAQGIPEGDGGFALMSKDPGFGVSQFMENARYQHALETELAHTIANLKPVEGARVHLALPQQSAFVRDRHPASASVFVNLKAGRRLESEQVTAVVNLVASSIPELDASQVTVIDQQGHLLSAPEGHDEFAVRDKQFEISRKLEDIYTQRVEELLAPLVGPGRVRAQVVADVEMSVTEETREQYRPESQIVRSEQLSEEASRSGAGPQGVPGALTNQPPQGGVALPPGAAANAPAANAQSSAPQTATGATTPDNSSKQTTRNYEIDRTLAYTKSLPGRLKRLSVAVLVDNQRVVAEDGKVTETVLTPAQVENMTKLVKDAVGFNTERGDSVNVINASFRPEAVPAEGELEKVPLWERPMVLAAAKLGLGAIILLVLTFAVLKPLLKNLTAAPLRERLIAHAPAEPAPQLEKPGANAAVAYEQQVAQAKTLVSQDPRRVAQVVKTWVGDEQ
jgi:flagellar M-ring protein FliF